MTRWAVPVPMRDGIRLSADIYFPAGGEDGGPYPAIVSRTPYDKQHPVYVAGARQLAEHGYVSVLQDVRGRHDSEGTWIPFRQEGLDGYDTIEWTAAQPWCTGKVGTLGGSYGGWFQWALAREKPPHLAAMVSTASCGAWFEELPYDRGCVMLVLLGWLNLVSGRGMKNADLVDNWPDVFRHLPLRAMPDLLGRDIPAWSEWLDHPSLDRYWRELRLDDDFAHIDVPVLHITGWWDDDQAGALSMLRGMASSARAADQALLIGPWDHAGTRVPRRTLGDVDMGPGALTDVIDLHRRWYDHWLKGEGERHPPAPARLFLTGCQQWVDAPSFPPPTEEVTWFLVSGGRANTVAGDGRLVPEATSTELFDQYVYDPRDPVPAVIDENFYAATVVETPLDHRFKHRRDDVLCYTSDPADVAMTLVGFCEVHLFATTDGPDTDWFVAVHDVAPTGASMILCDGRLRARFNESLEEPTLRVPGQVYEYVIRTSALGHVLLAGHRLRVTVTSSDFPVWDRNLNTGGSIADGIEMRVATNQVWHRPTAPSHIRLPVVRSGVLTEVVTKS